MTAGISTKFEYHLPNSIGEALDLLKRYDEEAKLLAGGHSLIPVMKLRLASPKALIDMRKISDLKGIREDEDGLRIGAMTTYRELETSEIIRRSAQVIAETIPTIADMQVRNMGTIGGSMCHADPAGDLPAVILALDAELEAVSTTGTRTIQVDDFFIDFFTTSLTSDEILTAIKVPNIPPRTGVAYMKLPNKASHYALVGVAASVTLDDAGTCRRVRVGVTGAGEYPRRAKQAEASLMGHSPSPDAISQAANITTAAFDGRFNDDIHASAEYREEMLKVFARRALTCATERAM